MTLFEILKNLKAQRVKMIFNILKDHTEHGGTAGTCQVNWWGENPNHPELYRLECQIKRYKARIESEVHV
jgi:hypothetical protein